MQNKIKGSVKGRARKGKDENIDIMHKGERWERGEGEMIKTGI